MALDKVLKIYDEQGNPVDYDILARDIKFLPNGKDLPTKLTEMEDAIKDAAESGGYEPPVGGIPKTDLAPAVQTSLGLADTALQAADKTQLQAAINAVQTALNNLMNGASVTDAIDTFNEIKAFLEGIDTDDPTLANRLLALNNAISALQTALAGKISGIKANGASTTLPVDQNGVVELPPAGSTISPATAAPSMAGTAAVGSSAKYAREDHVHPHDSTKQDTLTFDNAPTTGSNNPVKSGGVKQAIDEKLSNVTVNAIPANSVTLQATESNGVLSIFLADNTPILQLSDTELSIGASGGDFTLNGLYLQNDIEMAVTGDFSLSGTNVVEANGLYKILAANANGSNTVHVAYSGSSGSASGSIAITCGSVSLSVSSIVYSNLPSNYTLCDYIESTSTSYNSNYIKTDVPISSEIRVVAKIQNSKPNMIRFLYGARVYDNNGAVIKCRVEGQTGVQGGTDVKNQRLIVHGSTFDESYMTDSATAHEFDVNKSRIIYDGTTYAASTIATAWSYPSAKMVICGQQKVFTDNADYADSDNPTLAKYYYFKIYDGDTLVRDYIPAKDNTTGKYGLYDLVNNTFSTSAGSVEFTGQVTT